MQLMRNKRAPIILFVQHIPLQTAKHLRKSIQNYELFIDTSYLLLLNKID